MAEDRDIAHFDRWSSHYDRSILQRFFFGPVQKATISEAGINARSVEAVLDVGCGTGQLLRRMVEHFPDAELVGVDPAPGMVKQARAAVADGRRIEFVNGSVEKLPFPDAHFDLVLTTLSFHHWADQQQGLHEVRRVIRDGGLFVLSDIVAARWLRLLLARPSQGRFNSPAVLDRMLDDQNLRTFRRASVPWRPQIKITLARAER